MPRADERGHYEGTEWMRHYPELTIYSLMKPGSATARWFEEHGTLNLQRTRTINRQIAISVTRHPNEPAAPWDAVQILNGDYSVHFEAAQLGGESLYFRIAPVLSGRLQGRRVVKWKHPDDIYRGIGYVTKNGGFAKYASQDSDSRQIKIAHDLISSIGALVEHEPDMYPFPRIVRNFQQAQWWFLYRRGTRSSSRNAQVWYAPLCAACGKELHSFPTRQSYFMVYCDEHLSRLHRAVDTTHQDTDRPFFESRWTVADLERETRETNPEDFRRERMGEWANDIDVDFPSNSRRAMQRLRLQAPEVRQFFYDGEQFGMPGVNAEVTIDESHAPGTGTEPLWVRPILHEEDTVIGNMTQLDEMIRPDGTRAWTVLVAMRVQYRFLGGAGRSITWHEPALNPQTMNAIFGERAPEGRTRDAVDAAGFAYASFRPTRRVGGLLPDEQPTQQRENETREEHRRRHLQENRAVLDESARLSRSVADSLTRLESVTGVSESAATPARSPEGLPLSQLGDGEVL